MALSDYFDIEKVGYTSGKNDSTSITSVPADDSNVTRLNQNRNITFIVRRIRNKWFSLASSRTGIRLTGKFAIGKIGIRNPGETLPNWGGAGNPNSLKDSNITLDNAFFGRPFSSMRFKFENQSSSMEEVTYFPEYFQLISNLQKPAIREMYGTMASIHPDKSTETNANPNIVITAIARADIAVGVLTSLAVVYAHTAAVAVTNPLTILTVNIPGSLATWKLTPVAAYAANEKGQYMIRYTFAAIVNAQVDTFLDFDGVVIRARTDANTVAATEASFGIAFSPNRVVKAGEEFNYPLLSPSNRDYNSGFRDRMLEYNYKIAEEGKQRNVEIFVPLYFFLGFAAFYNRLICNFGFELQLTRAPDNNEFWGSKGLDGDFKIDKIALEIEDIFPNLSMQTRMLDKIKSPVKFQFLKPFVQQLMIKVQEFSVPFSFPNQVDFIFIMFKDHANVSHNNSALKSKTLLTHAHIQNLRLILNNQKYPIYEQNADFANGKYKQFYNEFCLATEKLFLGIPINADDYRDLYPIFGFDITDQMTIIKSSTAIALTVEGKRTLFEPKEIDIFICGFVLQSYNVDYTEMTIKDTP